MSPVLMDGLVFATKQKPLWFVPMLVGISMMEQDLSLYIQPFGPDGYESTIGELVRRAIVDNDSAATDILLARLGGPDVVKHFSDAMGSTARAIFKKLRESYPTATVWENDNYNSLAIGFGPPSKPSLGIAVFLQARG